MTDTTPRSSMGAPQESAVIMIVVLNALGLAKPSDTGALLSIFGILYFFLSYIVDEKLSEAKKCIKKMKTEQEISNTSKHIMHGLARKKTKHY